ncbi:uncharacterized protein LOC131023268 [Salvia miltiorrhiza]|uniref:uncharacterized protein LOC131023268 n=1 Tax=Salvia miltiorrhiza TaxID=226208 RepID=UPI0025AB752C|nr:uncharacterized protein LOC131023268 [Salvia miltiorrhiza]
MAEKAACAFGEDLGNAKFNFPENPPKIEIQVAAARFAHASTGAETSGQVDDLDSQSNSLSSSKALQHAESPCPSVSGRLQTTAGVRCYSSEIVATIWGLGFQAALLLDIQAAATKIVGSPAAAVTEN